jgi:hypothetical protein
MVSFLKTTEVAHLFELLSSTVKVMYKFRPKMGWATFWATFLHTHLVTLVLRPIVNFAPRGKLTIVVPLYIDKRLEIESEN